MNKYYKVGIALFVLLLSPQTLHAASPTLKAIEDEFIQLSEGLSPSVVEITASKSFDESGMGGFEDVFRFFNRPQDRFRNPRRDPEPEPFRFRLDPESPERDPDGVFRIRPPDKIFRGPDGELPIQPRTPAPKDDEVREFPKRTSTGSGFIYDADGHIVTNNHVVADAETIKVTLWDGTERSAVVVGVDPGADLAVIKIDPEGFPLAPCKLGDSDSLRVGQFAVAMGSPSQLTGTMSFGHISGLGREELRLPDPNLRFQSFIQTDAAINLGNSGGPLCNIDGEVIGVNIAIVFGANSIGFAIPVNRVKEVIPQLIAHGKVIRGWLGVRILNVDEEAQRVEQTLEDYMEAFALPDDSGAVVYQTTPDGPAEIAGIEVDDVIRRIGESPVRDKLDLIAKITDIQPGTEIPLAVWRDGREHILQVVIDEFPKEIDTALYGKTVLGLRIVEIPASWTEQFNTGDSELKGVLVFDVVRGSPGAEAGLRRGHVIVEIAHTPVHDVESFRKLIKENAEPDKTLLIGVVEPDGTTDNKFLKVPADYNTP